MGVCDEPLAAQGLRAERIRVRVAWRDEVRAARRGRRAASIAHCYHSRRGASRAGPGTSAAWRRGHDPRPAALAGYPDPPSGRSLLAHAEREQLTATASFTPTGEPATRSSQVITVAR